LAMRFGLLIKRARYANILQHEGIIRKESIVELKAGLMSRERFLWGVSYEGNP
jgi:hypothetical protein